MSQDQVIPLSYEVCTNRKLDLLELPRVEENIVESRLETVETLSQLPKLTGNGGDLCFHVGKNEAEVTSLHDSFLQLKIRVIKLDDQGNEKFINPTDVVSYSPYISQSLFKSLQITLNNQPLYENADVYHAYKAFALTMMYAGENAQRSTLAGTGFFPSTIGTHDVVDPTSKQMNTGLLERREMAVSSQLVEVVTPVINGLFQCPRILTGHNDLKLNFYLNSPDFCLVMPKLADGVENPKYDIRIEEARLFLQKYKLTEEASDAINEMRAAKGVVYPVIDHTMCNFIVQPGETSFRRALPLTHMPRMIYIFFVKRSALHSKHEDPFYFRNFLLKEAFIEADGRKFPQNRSYTPELVKGHYVKDFRMLQGEMGYKLPSDTLLTLRTWTNGIFILPFNMTPDRTAGCDYISPDKPMTSPITVNLNWAEETTDPISVMVMVENYKLLHIDNDGKISWSY